MLTPEQEAHLGDNLEGDMVRTIDVLADRIKELETRIKQLELREQQSKFVGAWEAGKTYSAGNFVNFQGELWHANVRTKAKPGTAPVEWQLCVKRGRDAKDGGRYEAR